MRISDRYIGKQVLLGTLYAVMVLGLVLVLGNLFKKIQPLLVDWKVPPEVVLRFVINVLPQSLLYTVPWGFLSAVLLVFSRLSSHQEITSFRVAGVSLVRLSVPVFVIGAALSCVSLWLNLNVVPQSKASVAQLFYDQARRDPASLIKPGVAQGNFKGDSKNVQLKILIEAKDGSMVQGFHFYKFSNSKDDETTYVHAAKAGISVIAEKSQLRVPLENASFESRKSDGPVESAFVKEGGVLLIDLKDPARNKKTRASAMTNDEILAEIANNPGLTPEKKVRNRAEITKRYSFSLACLAFAFIAVPLGLGSRRRDTSGGLVISLLIGTAYFVVTMLADQFKTDAGVTAMLWAPNAACVLLGLILFRRARFK